MRRIFICTLGVLIITAAGIGSAHASGTEQKVVKPSSSGSATEKPEVKVEKNENVASKRGSGTESEAVHDAESTNGDESGSTSEREAPKHPAGSGTERK